MPYKLTITSVELDEFTRKKSGCVAKLKATLNKQLIGQMGWGEVPEWQTSSDLDGEIACISLELIPNDEPMAKHATSLDLAKLHSFETVRLELEKTKGKGYRTQLRLKIESNDPQAARKLELYMLVSGKSKMVVSYEPVAKQEVLPGATADQEAAQATLQ